MVNVFHPPVSEIATWPKPNYVNPQTQGPALVITGVIMTVLGIITVMVRLYARIFVTRALGIDDILIVFAAIAAVVLCAVNIDTNIKYGLGHHIWDIPASEFVGHRLHTWIAMVCTIITKTLTKISVNLFYRRLSVNFSRMFLIAVWVGIVYNILYFIGFLLGVLLLCRPIKAYWLEFTPIYEETHPYTCGKERILEPLLVVFASVSDIYTAMIPIVLVFTLDLPASQKRALYVLFGLAFIMVVTGLVRVAYIYITLTADYDFTWELWIVWLLADLESWVAIMVASAPALNPLVKKFRSAFGHQLSEISQRRQSRQANMTSLTQAHKDAAIIKERHESVTIEEDEGYRLELGNIVSIEETDPREGHYFAQVWSGSTASGHTDDVRRGSEGAETGGTATTTSTETKTATTNTKEKRWWERKKKGSWSSVESLEQC